ncbi:hypothetical protein G3I42_24915 [Streptomyces sp. SID11385]|nr:hypothetical protein [Streptomyces sp. SID11385]
MIGFGRPVQLSLIALLHVISDEQGAHALVAALKDALAPGSQLVVTQAGFKRVDEADERYRAGRITLALRPREEIDRFFEGFTSSNPASWARTTGVPSRATSPTSASTRRRSRSGWGSPASPERAPVRRSEPSGPTPTTTVEPHAPRAPRHQRRRAPDPRRALSKRPGSRRIDGTTTPPRSPPCASPLRRRRTGQACGCHAPGRYASRRSASSLG